MTSKALAVREAVGDASALTTPRQYFQVENPFPGGSETVPAYNGELVLFLPLGVLWSQSARGFGQVRNIHPNDERNFGKMLQVFWSISFVIGEGVTPQGVPKQIVTWTTVPQAGDDAAQHAGFLLRVLYHMDQMDVSTKIEEALTYVDMALKDPSKAKGAAHRISTHQYQQMASRYHTRTLGQLSEAFHDLRNSSNAFNPFTVFSLTHAITKMRNANGMHADFLRISHWLNDNKEVGFPRAGYHTYRISPAEMNPADLRKFFFPHVQCDIPPSSTEYANFRREAGLDRHRPAAAAAAAAAEEDSEE
jgi:hypothetical protein